MRFALVIVCVVQSVAALAGDGPRLSSRSLFTDHLNVKDQILAGVSKRAASGDIDGAEREFASYVRETLRPERVLRRWTEKQYSSNALQKLRAEAADTMAYRLSSTGLKHQFKDGNIDWNFNPTFNGYKEWTWQLSRMPFWTRLAEYYVNTKDEEAARCWCSQIKSWFDQAQLERPTGHYPTCTWRTLEAGLRMEGWILQIHAFLHSPALSDRLVVEFFRSIWEHGFRLSTTRSANGNWVVTEKMGQLRIACLFPFFRESDEWRKQAIDTLVEELDRQVYPDGFQAELSTSYQSAIVRDYSGVIDLLVEMEEDPPEVLLRGLERLFDVYPRLMMPDGRTPDLNDGARIDVRNMLSVALRHFPGRADWRWLASLGARGTRPTYLSYGFPYAGSVVMRTSWSRDAVFAYMDCSPFGLGHQHEDKLNVIVSAYGKNMITEGGSYFYDRSEMRSYVLSTRAHNTVRIDGKDQNQRKTYRWTSSDISKHSDFSFSTSPTVDWCEASYAAGYGDDLDETSHTRKLVFFKDVNGLDPFFIVIDRLSSPDARVRSYEVVWHLATSGLVMSRDSFRADFGRGIGLSAAFSDKMASYENQKGREKPCLQGWLPIRAHGPHRHLAIPTPVSVGTFAGGKRLVTVLYPYRNGTNRIENVEAREDLKSMHLTLLLSSGRRLDLKEPSCPGR